jgi:predicted  nucleic acid-binding Zn-ribbon protein
VAIKQIVQSVITSTLPCVGKTQYLSDLLGRIETYIAIKSSQASQLSSIIATTQSQIASLRNQIGSYNTAISNLGIGGLQARLNDILDTLQLAYNAFNNGNIDLTPYNLNITANLQSIGNLTAQKAEASSNLNSDRKSLNDTLTLIASLQQQLAAANNNKDLLSARILQQTSNVTNITQAIDLLNADNVRLNNQINLINSNKTTLEAQYKALETQAENVKSTITAYRAQQNQYQAQITALNAQIAQISNNLDTTPLTVLNSTIANLQSSIPSLQQQIDYVKFNCLGVVNYTVSTLNGAISYVFGASSFSTYVTGQYGAPNSNTAQALLGPISNITLTPSSIFSSSWTDLYGQAFAKDLSLVSPSATSTPNFFISDFSCSSTSVLSSGNGVVK